MDIKLVSEEYSETISNLIQEAFKEQVRILNIDKKKYPNYVAFETPNGIIKDFQRGKHIAIAYENACPIGTVRYFSDRIEKELGYITRLAVLPQFRGSQYGMKLMEFAELKLKEQGIKEIEISLVAQFEKLQHYYQILGYKEISIKEFESLPFKVLFMRKNI